MVSTGPISCVPAAQFGFGFGVVVAGGAETLAKNAWSSRLLFQSVVRVMGGSWCYANGWPFTFLFLLVLLDTARLARSSTADTPQLISPSCSVLHGSAFFETGQESSNSSALKVVLRPPKSELFVVSADSFTPSTSTLDFSSNCAVRLATVHLELAGACQVRVELLLPSSEVRVLAEFAYSRCDGRGFQNVSRSLGGASFPEPHNQSASPDTWPSVPESANTSIRIRVSKGDQCNVPCFLRGINQQGNGIAVEAHVFDECKSNPCRHPLQCRNTVGGHLCRCPPTMTSLQQAVTSSPAHTDRSVSSPAATAVCLVSGCTDLCGESDFLNNCAGSEDTRNARCRCKWRKIGESAYNCSLLQHTSSSVAKTANPHAPHRPSVTITTTGAVPSQETSADVQENLAQAGGGTNLNYLFIPLAIVVLLLIVLVITLAKRFNDGKLSWAMIRWRLRYAAASVQARHSPVYAVTREYTASNAAQNGTLESRLSLTESRRGDSAAETWDSARDCAAANNGLVHDPEHLDPAASYQETAIDPANESCSSADRPLVVRSRAQTPAAAVSEVNAEQLGSVPRSVRGSTTLSTALSDHFAEDVIARLMSGKQPSLEEAFLKELSSQQHSFQLFSHDSTGARRSCTLSVSLPHNSSEGAQDQERDVPQRQRWSSTHDRRSPTGESPHAGSDSRPPLDRLSSDLTRALRSSQYANDGMTADVDNSSRSSLSEIGLFPVDKRGTCSRCQQVTDRSSETSSSNQASRQNSSVHEQKDTGSDADLSKTCTTCASASSESMPHTDRPTVPNACTPQAK